MNHLLFRKIIAIVLTISLFPLCLLVFVQDVQALSVHVQPKKLSAEHQRLETPALPRTNARAAALVDVTSGRVLYSEHGDQQLPMASTTKIMTAILAIELGNLKDQVKISKTAFGKEGSSIYLRKGEVMSLEDLLYGLMLRSGNDAAVAIAEHIGGSEEGFVFLMNQKAEEIGLDNTQFRNPHGLDADGHYTSAIDLAKLSAYALHNATFREIVKTRQKTAPNPIDDWDYKWTNKNKMLRKYEGADGVKTGFTSDAHRCLVSSATRNGQQLTAVTLNDGSDWVDHERMLNYGFSQYPLRAIVTSGHAVEGYPFLAAEDVKYPLAVQEQEEISYKVKIFPPHSLDYRLGRRGQLEIYHQQEQIASVPLKG